MENVVNKLRKIAEKIEWYQYSPGQREFFKLARKYGFNTSSEKVRISLFHQVAFYATEHGFGIDKFYEDLGKAGAARDKDANNILKNYKEKMKAKKLKNITKDL